MSNPELRGESFLIVGFGREGQSLYRYLKALHPKARIAIADRNLTSLENIVSAEQAPTTELLSGPSYLESAASFSTVIRSPGVSIREIQPFLGSASHLTSATNIFFAECPGRIVGVTGTKGKSTTSSLTAAILSKAHRDVRLVGNIGTPMLDYLAGATSDTIFVIELSSYQLEDLRISPHVAILLNIVPEHLDYHGGFDNYRNAKLNIARHQNAAGTLIHNQHNSSISACTGTFQGKRLHFHEQPSETASVFVRDNEIVIRADSRVTPLIPTAELPVIGPGNLQNALAAITCGVSLGASADQIRAGLAAFKPLEHRLELVAERFGITFFNDSLSTIPEALAHALAALGDRVETVIAGGFDRGVDMASVGPALAASRVKNLILFPTTGEKLWQAATSSAPERAYIRVDVENMDDAVQAAYDLTSSGKICVMSPASSSFSVFRDYRERGEKFKDAVRRLSPRAAPPADAA